MDRGSRDGTTATAEPLRPAITCNPDAVPEALRQRRQWVAWRYVLRDGQPTKIPINVRTGREADCTDLSTWSTFAEVVHALGEGSAFAGIGFVFAPDDPFCGIDLDDCLNDEGTLVDSAQQIVDTFNSYTEVSPSGNGVKIIIEGTKTPWARCRSKQIEGFKETEVYDRRRFFTITGHPLPGTPEHVANRQHELNDLCRRLWPKRESPAPPPPSSSNGEHPDDDTLLKRMFASKKGDAIHQLWGGDTSGHGEDDSGADLALCNHLAFWTGRDKDQMDRLFRRSGLYREKWERDDYRTWTLDRAIADCREVYGGAKTNGRHPPQRDAAPKPASDEVHKPTIFIGVDEHRVIDETVAALTSDSDLYQRGNVLVRLHRDQHASEAVIRPEGSAIIVQVPTPNLRDRITRHAHFTCLNRKGNLVAAHPTDWLVQGIDARGAWPGIRHLMGVSDVPVLRADGSVWQTSGYDAQTGVLFQPSRDMVFPHVPEQVNEDDADAALHELLEVVCDFRFEDEEHKSAWLAALLTPLARFAFGGPTPLFLVDANVRGAGKGLLTQTIGQIVLGREMPVSGYAAQSEEMGKRITAMAIAGDRMVLLDNLEGSFGNDALDRALTTTRWKDRILGKSKMVDVPLLAVWYATGNNVQVAADTTRRIIHIRLDVLEEHPEDRSDFRHPDLVGWLKQERGRLLAAALTILSAYIRSGKPKQDLTPMGSFEGWSRLVRETVVWLGLPDPCLTRVKLAESADTTVDTLTQLITAWSNYDPHNSGIVIAEMLARLYPSDGQFQPRDEAAEQMRAALENAVGCPGGKAPTNRQVGNRLKHFRRRVVEGQYLDCDPGKSKRGKVWRVMRSGGEA
ncbi:MAG: hypothetical protein WD151_07710 [Phycisphaeraceae bacterium]